MNPKSTDNRKYVGYLGECIAQLELARKGLKIDRTSEGMIFDFVASNGATLEIKTSKPYINNKNVVLNKKGEKGDYFYKNWKFRISKDQDWIDFYVLVLLDEDKTYLNSFVIPNSDQTSESLAGKLIVISEDALKGNYKTRHSSQKKTKTV
jgi:hypothetical protein